MHSLKELLSRGVAMGKGCGIVKQHPPTLCFLSQSGNKWLSIFIKGQVAKAAALSKRPNLTFSCLRPLLQCSLPGVVLALGVKKCQESNEADRLLRTDIDYQGIHITPQWNLMRGQV